VLTRDVEDHRAKHSRRLAIGLSEFYNPIDRNNPHELGFAKTAARE